MSSLILFFVISFLLGSAVPPWHVAHYSSLTIGKSSRGDVERLLGSAVITREQDTGDPIVTYQVDSPVPGLLTVHLKRGVVDGLTLTPKDPLSAAEAIQLFGTEYVPVQYGVDECLTQNGSAPIFELPGGPISHLEYRGQGIGLVVKNGLVVAIAYTDKPFGPTHSRCAAKSHLGKRKVR